MKKTHKGDIIFYVVMLAWPVLQFCVFYIGVNARSLLFSFQNIDILTGETTWTTNNLVKAFNEMTSPTLMNAFKVSILSFALIFFIGTPLALLFSYFIYKKLPCSNFFKVLLFLPSILSAVVMVSIFQFFVERAIPAFATQLGRNPIKGLLENPDTRYGTIIFYNIFISFGTSVLMYSNAMSGISQDVIEAGKLDGVGSFREFFNIILPNIYPTITTFTITSVAAIFLNQICLYSFFEGEASPLVQTYGYYLYKETLGAVSQAEYPRLSSMGLLLTVVAVPLTLLVKRLMEHFGPSDR